MIFRGRYLKPPYNSNGSNGGEGFRDCDAMQCEPWSHELNCGLLNKEGDCETRTSAKKTRFMKNVPNSDE